MVKSFLIEVKATVTVEKNEDWVLKRQEAAHEEIAEGEEE